MDDTEFKVLCGVILSLMVCFGIVGNVISLITWRVGRRCKNFPGATYLTALALSDTLVLCTSGIKSTIELIFQINIWHLNLAFCKVLHTTWHFFFLVSTWIIVSLTVERTVAVCQPLKSFGLWSKKRETIVVCVLTIFCFVVNLPFTVGAQILPTHSASSNENHSIDSETVNMSLNLSENFEEWNTTMIFKEKCQADPASFYFKYETEYHNWFIDFVLLFSAPISILAVCNVIILVMVKRTNPILKKLRSQCLNKQDHSSAMTARVVALCLTLGVSVGPFSIAAVIPNFMLDNKAVSMISNDRLRTVFVLIWFINNSVNFILYSVLGKAFRYDCVALFQTKSCCRKKRSTPAKTFQTLSSISMRLSYRKPRGSILSNKISYRPNGSNDCETCSSDLSYISSDASCVSKHRT